MLPSFNLLDSGWIPCLRSTADPPEYLSIRQVLHQANQIRQISDPAPTVTAMLHRLLLAILHRSLNGPQSTDQWAAVWRAGIWDVNVIDAYLNHFQDRFDLFDAVHPFYQATGLDADAFREVNQITNERASGRNRPLLFDHSLPGMNMSPADAARYLIAQQAFSVGGLFGLNRTDPPSAKYAPSSPLLKSAICLAIGDTLFETLMLNWRQYNQEAEVPFPFVDEDRPAWERDEPTTSTERRPSGWVDLLTWQCRRICLQPSAIADGAVAVTRAALMQGFRFPATFDQHQAESMVAYTVARNAAQADRVPWFAIGFSLGKGAWRDSHALFQSVTDSTRPRILDWLQRLIAEGKVILPKIIPLNVYGIIPDQARIDDWRGETLALPHLCLERTEIADKVGDIMRREIGFAEQVGQLLEPRLFNIPHQQKALAVKGPSPVRVLAEELLRSTSDRKADAGAITALGQHYSPIESYWAALEDPFRRFIVALADDVFIDEFGDPMERGRAAHAWADQICRIARQCFDDMATGLETSARAWRAGALARSRFDQLLYRLKTAHDELLPPTKGADL
jgi:CRISPR system Cascade subunit CasA